MKKLWKVISRQVIPSLLWFFAGVAPALLHENFFNWLPDSVRWAQLLEDPYPR